MKTTPQDNRAIDQDGLYNHILEESSPVSFLLHRFFSKENFMLALAVSKMYDREIKKPMSLLERGDFIIGFQLGVTFGRSNKKHE